MDWMRASEIMEGNVVKTDVIASEDAYFMATHVPFSNLEVVRGGQYDDRSTMMSEEEVFERLIYNPDNFHRLIIVRGNNGTGKSHLIRWLRARFENDSSKYDPSSEKIIFLRRLSNTIRGAIRQILDENIILDEAMKAKLEKFVDSTDSLDPEAFKNQIHQQYAAGVLNDTTSKSYSKGVRQEIYAFLMDARIREHLLSLGGPVDRCYQAITAPSNSLFHGEAIFTAADFSLSRPTKRQIKKSGSEEAQAFLLELEDTDSVEKFVKYLNGFTSKVIQGCAEISSESTKDIFVQLRRELKRQGKNLTIFIEDFTAFTGLDSELITVLASEHGGENSDLCRVTSVIGITDAYYKQFRDNFTDRVQYQVNVTEGAYGNSDFLTEMTARYLNAVYCEPSAVSKWFKEGAKASEMPVSGFFPDYEWDSVMLSGHKVTLYPFTKAACRNLYEALHNPMNSQKSHSKTPRMFLIHVFREQMSRFIDGIEFGEWNYPSDACIASTISLKNAAHNAEIDGLSNLSPKDRLRLKVLLQFWGDGTAQATNTQIGGIPKKYIESLQLGGFTGFGGSEPKSSLNLNPSPTPIPIHGGGNVDTKPLVAPVPPAKSKREVDKERRLNDINNWFNNHTELGYSNDFRKWVLDFLREAIAWPADGVPAYIVRERFTERSCIFIEGQKENTSEKKALIKLYRNNDDKNFLLALLYRRYADSWDFENGAYFQLKTVNWIERHKSLLIKNILQSENNQCYPYVEWCAAIEYLRSVITGSTMCSSDKVRFLHELLADKQTDGQVSRKTNNPAWRELNQFLRNNASEYVNAHELLKESLRTFMGTDVNSRQHAVDFYRTSEIYAAVCKLETFEWDIETQIPNIPSEDLTLLTAPSRFLGALYKRIKVVVTEEDEIARMKLGKLQAHVGEISRNNIARLITEITGLFQALYEARNPVDYAITSKFTSESAEDIAASIMRYFDASVSALSTSNHIKKLCLYSSDPISEIASFVDVLDKVEEIAEKHIDSNRKAEKKLSGDYDVKMISQKGVDTLSMVMGWLDDMEVRDAD